MLLCVLGGLFFFRELLAAVTALLRRDGRSGRGAFARRGVMKGEGFVAKGQTGAVSLSAGWRTVNDWRWVHPQGILN